MGRKTAAVVHFGLIMVFFAGSFCFADEAAESKRKDKQGSEEFARMRELLQSEEGSKKQRQSSPTGMMPPGMMPPGMMPPGMIPPQMEGKRAGDTAKAKKPDEVKRILFEVYLVEVDLDALYESGVTMLGEEGKNVSVMNILWCLKDQGDDNGRILTAVRVGARNGSEASYDREKNVYVAVGPEGNRRWDQYTSGINLRASGSLEPQGYVSCFVDLSYTGFGTGETDGPKDRISVGYDARAVLEDGKPAILGASQGEEKAEFLIVTAHIQ